MDVPNLFAVVFIAILGATAGLDLFHYTCEPGCAERVCTRSVGCTNCLPGYCAWLGTGHNTESMCMPVCPRGKECKSIAGMRICTRASSTTTTRSLIIG